MIRIHWLMRWSVNALVATVSPVIFSCPSPAQPASTAAAGDMLARLIKDYDAQRALIERPLLTAYAQRLAALRATLEKRRDPSAAAVATELATVQARLNRLESGAADAPLPSPKVESLGGPLELTAHQARTSGEATPAVDENGAVRFNGADATAEWSLPAALPTGRYRLLWRIACNAGAGARVRLLIDGQPPRTLEIQPTTAAGETVVANLGEFTAATAPSSLRVEVLSVAGRPRQVGPGFSLGRIILIPPGVTMPGL